MESPLDKPPSKEADPSQPEGPLKTLAISLPAQVSSQAELEQVIRKHQQWMEHVLDPNQETAEGRANFFQVDLSHYDFTGVNLRCADFREANLYKANFRKANLASCDFRGAMLREADLREANLKRAQLAGADLSGALLDEAILTGSDLSLGKNPLG